MNSRMDVTAAVVRAEEPYPYSSFMKIPAILLFGAIALIIGTPSSALAQKLDGKQLALRVPDAIETKSEAKKRRETSIQLWASEGIKPPAVLPATPDAKQVKLRSKEEIAHRAVALCIVALKGESGDQATTDALMSKLNAERFLTPQEAAFIKNPAPSEDDRIQFSWRYECLWALLWSLGYVEKLERPISNCDAGMAVAYLIHLDVAKFVAEAKPRSAAEILDASDLMLGYHWAVIHARLKGEKPPAMLNPGVVQERRQAFNWLIGRKEQDWDKVTTELE